VATTIPSFLMRPSSQPVLDCSGDPATDGVLRGLWRRATGRPPVMN